jgi:methionine sulfoxide reductase heme-binding subunit
MARAIKAAVAIAALIPAGWLAYALYSGGDLGVNPAETLQLQTGIWALRFLLISLAITPLRRITKWNRIISYRKTFGLLAFFYATLHLATYVVLDRYFDWAGIWEDTAKRPFITAGMVAFALLVPLALTSTKGAIRRMGKRWTQLHRIVYVAAIAAIVHYLWKVKVMGGSPVYYAMILAVLLGFRVAWAIGERGSRRRIPDARATS